MMRSGSVSLWVGEGKSIYLSDDSNQTVSFSLPLPIPTLETDEIRHTRREFLFSPPSSYEPKKKEEGEERERETLSRLARSEFHSPVSWPRGGYEYVMIQSDRPTHRHPVTQSAQCSARNDPMNIMHSQKRRERGALIQDDHMGGLLPAPILSTNEAQHKYKYGTCLQFV